MLQRFISLVLMILFFTFQSASSAMAIEIDEATRTVKLNDHGETITLSQKQVKEGKRLFNYACAQCHAGGITKNDVNLSLSPTDLGGANPPRDNIVGLVDYLHNPTTYDGSRSIAELHPSTSSADIFASMRNLTEEDLVAIAGHIMTQPKILGDQWGGGKTIR